MKRILYFLIGCLIQCLFASLIYADECLEPSCVESGIDSIADELNGVLEENNNVGHFSSWDACYNAIASSAGQSATPNYSLSISCGEKSFYIIYYISQNSYINGTRYYSVISGSYSETYTCLQLPDSDGDNIPDGLDAYPDTDGAYQFRIMTNYFDAEGNCVGQLIVTSSGDYVLLGDLTAAEIEAGVSAGTYKSDFVNSPIWIDSSDLEEDNASDIYASGDSTTPVNSTTASSLTSSATTADANDLSTADGVTAGSTYDSGSDTDSSALGKIVDNTAATTSNQQTLANYAKKQSELQSTGNALLGKINDTLKRQSNDIVTIAGSGGTDDGDGTGDSDDQEIAEGKSELEGLNVDTLLGEDIKGELIEGEDGDYQDHGEIADEEWVKKLINSNPIVTVLSDSGFKYSNSSATVSADLGRFGTQTLDISDLEAILISAGNLLVSFSTLIGLIHVITGRGF